MVAGWELPPRLVAIFGSAARRDGDSESDIDLLVVRDPTIAEADLTWSAQTAMLTEVVATISGNHVQLVELTIDELARAHLSGEPLIDSLLSDARTLFGEDLESLLAEGTEHGTE